MTHALPANLPFDFVADPSSAVKHFEDGVRVLRVTAGLVTKPKLLDYFAVQLSFPLGLFRNWDAFRDILLDLSWLEPIPHQLWIVHDDFPLRRSRRDQSVYLSILAECSVSLKEPVVRVIFPQAHEATIRQLWRELT